MRFMRYKWWYFGLSLVILIPGLVSLARYRLKPAIDFTGGTLLEIQINQPKTAVESSKLVEIAAAQQLELSAVVPSADNVYLLKLKPIAATAAAQLQTAIGAEYGQVTEKRFETVGPVIGRELTQKALLAIVVASMVIVVYIAWSFRSVPRPYSSWKFGLSAVVALIHDALVVLGLFSLLGHFWGVEVDALFVTAMLTVIGFSVHDTIVVFDRVRENLPKMPQASFTQVVDFSIAETLVRSVNTSITVVLTLVALLLFGGASVRWFVLALLVGIVSGTYSSIFNAAPLLVLWESPSKVKA